MIDSACWLVRYAVISTDPTLLTPKKTVDSAPEPIVWVYLTTGRGQPGVNRNMTCSTPILVE